MAIQVKAKRSAVPQHVPDATNPDGIRNVYANNAGLGATMTDVQMIFTHVGQGSGSNEELRPENRVVAMVTIPLTQVNQLIAGLSNILSSYQANAEAFKKMAEEHFAAQKK